MSISTVIQILFSGLTSGAIYAVVALAFSVTYTSSGVVNFAQGQFVMVGGMLAATCYGLLGFPLPLAVLCALGGAALLGMLVGRFMMLPMLKYGEFTLILITLGLGMLLEAVATILWTNDPWSLPSLSSIPSIGILKATLTGDSILIFVSTIVILTAFVAFIRYTRWGRAMKASSIDRTVALSLGINVNRVIVLSFVMSATLGAAAGVLATPLIATSSQTGMLMTMKGFAAAVLGGLGSPIGAVLGAFILGIIEAFAGGFISTAYQNAVALALLIVMLMVKPEGLFGKRVRKT